MVFMMLAGVSFALYFVAWRSRSLRVLWADPELRAYFGVVFGSIAAHLGLPDGARQLRRLPRRRCATRPST